MRLGLYDGCNAEGQRGECAVVLCIVPSKVKCCVDPLIDFCVFRPFAICNYDCVSPKEELYLCLDNAGGHVKRRPLRHT